jgi:hypothetical protein
VKARGRIRTDGEGRYWFRSIRPTFYPVPTDGPVGTMLRKMGRHPFRPGHIHMNVSAPGHLPATTHLFVAGSEYLDSDAVFGMKESLVAQFDRHPPGAGPNGEHVETPFYTVNYDFRLRLAGAAGASPKDGVRPLERRYPTLRGMCANRQTTRCSIRQRSCVMQDLLQYIDLDYYRAARLAIARAEIAQLRQRVSASQRIDPPHPTDDADQNSCDLNAACLSQLG